MQRRYFLVSIIMLAVVAGCALILFTGSTPHSGSNALPGETEQTKGVVLIPTPAPYPLPVITSTSPKLTTPSLPPITVGSGSGAVYPYLLSLPLLEIRVHELINRQRSENGLGTLQFDRALADIARNHSEDMATQGYFAHENPAGQDPTARGIAAGYSCRKNYGSYYTYGLAENLFQNNLYSSATYFSNRTTAYAWTSPEEIAQSSVAGWMNSSGHRENILTSSYEREGIGVAIASEKVYITEDFC